MARIFILLGALLFVLAPCIGLPQGMVPIQPQGMVPMQPPPAPGWQNAGQWQFPTQPGLGWGANRNLYEDELWRVAANVTFGHQWMGWKAYFPFASNPDPEAQVFDFERMEITLKDANFWVGYAGLEVQPAPRLVLFGRYGTNIPHSSTVEMDATGRATRPGRIVSLNPLIFEGNGANTISPWFWDTWFHWWMLEAGGAWWFTPELAFEVGFRTEHVDYKLQNPRNLSEALLSIPPGLPVT